MKKRSGWATDAAAGLAMVISVLSVTRSAILAGSHNETIESAKV
jgi:hypothetical protein